MTVDVLIDDPAWGGVPEAERLCERAAMAALAAAGGGQGASLALLLAGDAAVAELNARFRGKPGPTNVLSFPARNPPGFLGDIALAHGVCAREAAEQGKPLPDHIMHLVVHGVLHLLGHDHDDDRAAEAMEALEVRVLAGLGVPDPYAAPAGEVTR